MHYCSSPIYERCMYICDVTEISLSNELVPIFITLRVREKVHLLVTDRYPMNIFILKKNVCRLVKVLIKKGSQEYAIYW